MNTTDTSQNDTLYNYYDFVKTTIQNPDMDNGGWWAASELASEAGEVLSLFTKAQRTARVLDRDALVDELGDVLWGVLTTCWMMDIDPNEIISYNKYKLTARMQRGMKTSADQPA